MSPASLVAQAPAKLPKANASRLTYDQDGVAYLKKVPFTGVAFWEESWGRAEVTYSNGIPHGEVTVVARNRLLYQFRYDQGKRVTNSVTSETGGTGGASPTKEAGDGGGDR